MKHILRLVTSSLSNALHNFFVTSALQTFTSAFVTQDRVVFHPFCNEVDEGFFLSLMHCKGYEGGGERPKAYPGTGRLTVDGTTPSFGSR